MSPERASINVLLRGEQSGGAVSVIGSGSLPGFGGPPLHHHDFDETFYVIEGELTDEAQNRFEALFIVGAQAGSRP